MSLNITSMLELTSSSLTQDYYYFFYMPGHDPFIIVKDDSRNKLELGFVSDLFVIYFKKEKKCRVLTKLDSISVSYFHKIG